MSPINTDRRRHAPPCDGRFHLLRALGVCLGLALFCSAGCRHASCVVAPGRVCAVGAAQQELHPTAEAFIVPADAGWIDAGIELRAGETFAVGASGRVVCEPVKSAADVEAKAVGPQGTYLYADNVSNQPFPLPAAAGGPAPAYALIGRIGGGPPFFVGGRMSMRADRDGRLQLRVNDFSPGDNSGRFIAQVQRTGQIEPVSFEQVVPLGETAAGEPLAGCPVVVFYMDGLRPDVIREMALMGHIPHIRRLFVEGGAWTENSFTAFPSDTVTSNGTMWTGCFSDRHGIKGQVRFSRRTLQSESYLEPLGPNRSARLLAPQGIDKALHEAQAATVAVVKGSDEGERWRRTAVTGVPPVYQHLRNNGGDWATGVLPMMTDMPPPLWTRSLVRHMPYLSAQDGWKYLDDANAHYATRHLLTQQQPVTIIWLPETDSVSHKFGRGQFGATRRTIAQADQLIGRVVEELQAQGRLETTYLMLVSDHGHHGGRDSHLSHFDIANELFYKPREVAADGRWIGGGLGMSVRQHRLWNRHPEDGSRDFVFIDGDAAGVARIFLPRGRFHSRDWMGEQRPADLLAYKTAAHQPPTNLIQSIVETTAVHGDGTPMHPVDLVLTRLDERSILISTVDRGHAVIDRRQDDDGRWKYKYTPASNLRPAEDGTIAFDAVPLPQVDPLGLVGHVPLQLLSYYHDERTWLRMTTETQYPDSVVALTRHMLWQENLKFRESEFAPDLVVTARAGWYFGNESSPGTMHGYPLADAMRATLFVCGPNVRPGARIVEPCRLADLTPTMLEMTGTPFDPADFDGSALRTIYAPDEPSTEGQVFELAADRLLRTNYAHDRQATELQPVYWSDVDLNAWQPLEYRPLKPYEHQPFTVNRPSSPFDLNNIMYNALSVTDVSVIGLLDDVLSPLTALVRSDPIYRVDRGKRPHECGHYEPGKRPHECGHYERGKRPHECGHYEHSPYRPIIGGAEQFDHRLRNETPAWIGEAAITIDLPGTTLGDYSATSLGNLKRADRAIDWTQNRLRDFDGALARPLGRSQLPGSRPLHATIDAAQWSVWELYRFTQRVVVQVVDETLINSLENGTDRAINRFRTLPAEIMVDGPPPAIGPDGQSAPPVREARNALE